VVLYELLAGRHPFGPLPTEASDGELRGCLFQRQARGPRPLREENAHVPPALARVVERCLAFDPGKRWDAPHLAAALRRDLAPLRRAVRRALAGLPAALRAAAVLAAAATASTAGMATRGYDGRPHVARGQAALVVKDQRQAVAEFSRALEADPDQYGARVGRAEAYQRLGRFEQARDDWAKADAQRSDGRTRASLAYCLSRLGKHALALPYYQGALDAGFATAPVLNDFGYSLYRQRDLEAAQKRLQEAVLLDPRLGAAHWNLALCDFERARRDPDHRYVPVAGITCVEAARTLGPSPAPASLHHHAAQLYAFAAGRLPEGQPQQFYLEKALDAVEQAVAQGCDPAALKEDYFLRILRGKRRFDQAVASPAPPPPAGSCAIPLVDPLLDLID
jgi:Tfp pilus assembly protein PilF